MKVSINREVVEYIEKHSPEEAIRGGDYPQKIVEIASKGLYDKLAYSAPLCEWVRKFNSLREVQAPVWVIVDRTRNGKITAEKDREAVKVTGYLEFILFDEEVGVEIRLTRDYLVGAYSSTHSFLNEQECKLLVSEVIDKRRAKRELEEAARREELCVLYRSCV